MNFTKSQYQRDGVEYGESSINMDMTRNSVADKLAHTHQELEKFQGSRGGDTKDFLD